MNRLVHYLQNIEDYRHPKGKRHQLLPGLIIMIMAMTGGYTGLDLANTAVPEVRGITPLRGVLSLGWFSDTTTPSSNTSIC